MSNPMLPKGVEVIVPPPPFESCTAFQKLLVYASSLIVVGSPIWFYGGIIYLYKRWRHYRSLAAAALTGGGENVEGGQEDDNKSGSGEDDNVTSSGESSQERNEKAGSKLGQRQQVNQNEKMQQYLRYRKLALRYGAALATIILLSVWGPHRSKKVGEWLDVRRWGLWDAWLNYVGFSVLQDRGDDNSPILHTGTNKLPASRQEFNIHTDPAIFAFVPHGVFPFGLAFACLPERGYQQTWGLFTPVVATATKLFPLVRTFIDWMSGVDASGRTVSAALSLPSSSSASSRRIGIHPGGIAEMFESYPKPGFHPNDEAALLKHRKGVFKIALRNKIPIVPVYCFGATKFLKRVQLPEFVETLSRALKISLCLFFGRWGLPIPFRQRLMYVIGRTIFPPESSVTNDSQQLMDGEDFDQRVQQMHDAFCDEIVRIFDRNKEHYGWGDKTLRLV